MLTICTWLWGNKYGPQDVLRLSDGVWRHLKQEYQFIVVTDNPQATSGYMKPPMKATTLELCQQDRHLLEVKGCFARLRMFDPAWQEMWGLRDRIACMDLDTVVTGPLDPLFNRPETFLILQGANAANPCPFNGSLMMLRAGAHPEVWTDFDLATELSWRKGEGSPIERSTYYEFPDDQGWIAHKLPNAAGWKVGSQSGVYAFMKPGWPTVDHEDICSGRKGKLSGDLPKDARMVVFPGWRSPEKFKHLEWVKENWR